ncbi:MAG: polysaccharide deacetylase family protein [Ruminococcaceae bacterium]|nr:polysaccharide deacetylase family protein [Oscillospiraceae bacterium]
MDIYRIFGRKQLLSIVLCAVILCAVLLTATGGAASVTASTHQRLLPIYAVGREEDDKVISISFDAAWGNEDTQTLIDILGRYNITATFFLVGDWVEKYPESVKQLSDAGHEIMNHSDTHPHMSKLSRDQMRKEIESCNDRIEAITGVRPTLFRAPYGEYCDGLIQVLDELGMHCIQWDVDSLDWKDPTPGDICSRVCSHVTPGSICLFHNAAKNTPAALPMLIEQLLTDGYTFVPISKNIHTGSCTIDHTGRQWPAENPSAPAA